MLEPPQQTHSLLDNVLVDSSGAEQLKSAGKWAKFIGIVYMISGIIMLVVFVGLFFSLDFYTDFLANTTGISDEAITFITSYGKWILLILILVTLFVIVVNAVSLIRFSQHNTNFYLNRETNELTKSFYYLKIYLIITVVLGIFGLIISCLAIWKSVTF